MICLFMLQSFSLSRGCRRICLLYPLLFRLVPRIGIKPAFPQWMNRLQEVENTAVIFPAICSRDSSQLCTRLCTSPDALSSAATWKAEQRDLFGWHGCPVPGGTWMWLQRSRNDCSHQQMLQKWPLLVIHAGIRAARKENKTKITYGCCSFAFLHQLLS